MSCTIGDLVVFNVPHTSAENVMAYNKLYESTDIPGDDEYLKDAIEFHLSRLDLEAELIYNSEV